MAEPGLRERKKQQTRQALSDAALRLSVDRGYGNVLVEDIAAAAGVSPRTFNNYFTSKAEAIVWRDLNRVRNMADLLRSLPTDRPLWTVLTDALVAQVGDEGRSPDPEWTAGVRLMLAEPDLLREMLRLSSLAERECADAVAERVGLAATDLYPRLVAAAANAASRVAIEMCLQADPPKPMSALLREALEQFGNGLPEPTTGH